MLRIKFDDGTILNTNLLNQYPKALYFIIKHQTDCVRIKNFSVKSFNIFKKDNESITEEAELLYKIITGYDYSENKIIINGLYYPENVTLDQLKDFNFRIKLFNDDPFSVMNIFSTSISLKLSKFLPKDYFTYFISPEITNKDTLNLLVLDNMLKQKGFKYEESNDKIVDFFFFGTTVTRTFIQNGRIIGNVAVNYKLYEKKSLLSTQIGERKKILSRKFIKDYYNQFDSINFKEKDFEKGKVYIFKSEGSFGGTGIKIIKDYSEIKKINQEGIIMEYVQNPLLTPNKKKFHFRIYLLIYYDKGLIRFYYFDQYRIYTAKKDYVNENYSDQEIHISTGPNTGHRFIFPNDFIGYNIELINKEINSLLINVCKKLDISDITTYSTMQSGFEVFGLDILFDQNYNVNLLEINKRPSYDCYGEQEGWEEFNKDFSTKYFNWILNTVVYPVFNYKKFPEPLLTRLTRKDLFKTNIYLSLEIQPFIVEKFKWLMLLDKKEIGVALIDNSNKLILNYFQEKQYEKEFENIIKNRIKYLIE